MDACSQFWKDFQSIPCISLLDNKIFVRTLLVYNSNQMPLRLKNITFYLVLTET